MSNVLLVEESTDLSMLIKLNLMKSHEVTIYEKENADKAIDLIEIIDEFDLIICSDENSEHKHCEKVSNYLISSSRSIPMLAVSALPIFYEHCKIVKPNQSWKVIVEMASSTIGIKNSVNEKINDFIAIPANYLLSITNDKMMTDIFIRLKKSNDEYQYLKRIHAGDTFELDQIQRYISSGLKDFYIARVHFESFVNHITESVVKRLKSNDVVGADRIKLNSESFEITQDRIASLGIDELTVELVQENILSMEKSLIEISSLSSFVKLLKSNQSSYAYGHVYLTCLLLHKLVESFEWHSKAVKDKLTYVAFFHDICLSDEKLIRIHSKSDFEKNNLSESEIKKVNTHAYEASKLLERFSEIPMGVGGIIKEHHASKTGVELPDSLSIAIAPMSMMLVVVESFVDKYFQLKDPTSQSEILLLISTLKEKFNIATYSQTINSLEQLVQNRK
jgi:hypothetical protein